MGTITAKRWASYAVVYLDGLQVATARWNEDTQTLSAYNGPAEYREAAQDYLRH